MKSNLLMLSVISLLSVRGFSQESSIDSLPYRINESAAYGSLGVGPVALSINANYEWLFRERPDKKFRKRGIRGGAGLWELWEEFGYFCLVDYVWLTGAQNKHFELGLGATYMQELTGDDKIVLPAGYFGYRYHKPDGKLVFRAGIGFPDGVFLCFGYGF